jgi:3-dehydroquinate synthetase
LVKDSGLIFNAMNSDKKKKQGKLKFIVPDEKSARIVSADSSVLDTVQKIIRGELSF